MAESARSTHPPSSTRRTSGWPAFLATLALASLVRRDRARHGPTSRRLCRALRLSKAEARLMGRVARAARAPGAGSLLVSRGYFDDAVGAYAAGPGAARRLEVIRCKVFE